jgi:hypothetical protein
MGLAGVDINVLNNQLGVTPSVDDGIVGLILTADTAPSTHSGNSAHISMSEPKQIFSTDDAKDLGIDDAYESNVNTDAWSQIKDFYATAGNGQELWIMFVQDSTTAVDIMDKANNHATKLLDAAQGAIKMLALNRVPDSGYTPTYTNAGFDKDLADAGTKAQSLTEEYADEFKPLRVILGARDFQGNVADLENMRERKQNRVQYIIHGIAGSAPLNKEAAVGRYAGRLAAISVHRNPGRVKDGDIGLNDAYFTDGTAMENYSLSEIEQMHDNGYVAVRKYQGKAGYYYTGSPMAVAETDDYNNLPYCRVIDKAIVLAYEVYSNEILDNVEVDPDTGQLDTAFVKAFQELIDDTITEQMLNATPSEISGVTTTMDPNQNVLATGKLALTLKVVPLGFAREIRVNVGFDNPNS